jgi:hypothetical protein
MATGQMAALGKLLTKVYDKRALIADSRAGGRAGDGSGARFESTLEPTTFAIFQER